MSRTETIQDQATRELPPPQKAGQSFRAQFIGWTGLCGKDLIRFFPIPFAIAVIALLVCLSRGILYYTGPALFHAMALATSVILGVATGADEEETGTGRFLDTLPPKRWRYLAEHVIAGAILIAFSMALMTAVVSLTRGIALSQILHELSGGRRELPNTAAPLLMLTMAPLAFYLTGLVVSMLLPNLAAAAIISIGSAFLLFWGLVGVSHLGVHKDLLFAAAVGCWIAGLCAAYPPVFASVRESTSSGFFATWSTRLQRVLAFRTECASDPAGRRMLTLPMWVLSVAGLFSPLLFHEPGNQAMLGCIGMMGASSVLMGVLAWAPAERDRTGFFLYALPIERRSLFLRRTRRLLLRVLPLNIGFIVFWLQYWRYSHVTSPGVWLLPLAVALTLSGAMIGAVMTFLIRSRIVALVFGCLVGCSWLFAAMLMLIGNPEITDRVWVLLVIVLFPLLIAYLAYVKSPLLEQSESRRGRVALILVPLMIVWGAVLVTMSPADIVRMIMAWGGLI